MSGWHSARDSRPADGAYCHVDRGPDALSPHRERLFYRADTGRWHDTPAGEWRFGSHVEPWHRWALVTDAAATSLFVDPAIGQEPAR